MRHKSLQGQLEIRLLRQNGRFAMFRRFFFPIGIAIAGSAIMSAAQAQTYPPAVMKVIAEARETCGADGGFKVNHRKIQRVDLFGRSRKDYVLNDDSWTCKDKPSMFTGTGGSAHWIVSDIKGEFLLIHQGFAREMTYDGKGGLKLSLHGSACDRDGYRQCVKRARWNGEKFAY
jgi:hypothetical protein